MPVSTLSSLALLGALNFSVLPHERKIFTSQSHVNGEVVFFRVASNRTTNMTAAGLGELVYNNIVFLPDSCNVPDSTLAEWQKSTLLTARGILASAPLQSKEQRTQTWYDLFFLLPVVYLYGFMLYRRRKQHYKDRTS